jgi:AcrR family transcriptional regulator
MDESPQRPPGRPRSEVSRAALLDAAYWQVVSRGYAEVTAEVIAKAAGAGKQTLYRWWPSKGRLVLEAFAAKARERIDRPREAALRAGDVEKFLVADLAAAAPFLPALRFLLAEAQTDPDLLAALRVNVLEPRAAALDAALERRVPDPQRRKTLVEAIDGAVWRRLLLGAPLDSAFAASLAEMTARPGL